MATRKEMLAEAEALASRLGRTVDSRGLNNAALADLVEELRDLAGDEPQDSAQTEPAAPPSPEPSARLGDLVVTAPVDSGPPPKLVHVVAPKKATIVKGKVVGGGTIVKASDFARGQADLDYLENRGVLVLTPK